MRARGLTINRPLLTGAAAGAETGAGAATGAGATGAAGGAAATGAVGAAAGAAAAARDGPRARRLRGQVFVQHSLLISHCGWVVLGGR